MICSRCGLEKEPDHRNPHMCAECVRAANNRLSTIRNHNVGWVEAAQREGLELYERQPGETQLEWTVWQAWRDTYPGKKPKYAEIAVRCDTTTEYVKKIAGRWQFNVRMQAWIDHWDKVTMQQRHEQMLSMNKDHIDMAERLRDKMSVAIDNIDPQWLKPTEIVQLSKLAVDLERSARVDSEAQEQILADSSKGDKNPNLKKVSTKQSDMSEIVSILVAAGALDSITTIGVKETTTREVVATSAKPLPDNDNDVIDMGEQ